jgi:hypothetical protein
MSERKSYAERATEKFLREELNRLLAKCTEKQRCRFAEITAVYEERIPEGKLNGLINLVYRTLYTAQETELNGL